MGESVDKEQDVTMQDAPGISGRDRAEESGKERCGLVAILGLANAGKSTLVNALVGEKVSIVSNKPHTTRGRILGVMLSGSSQAVLVDTPGLVRSPSCILQKTMMKSVWRSMKEADICVLIIDASRYAHEPNQRLLRTILEKQKPTFIVFNKVDAVKPKERLLEISEAYQEYAPSIENFFMISGLKQSGLKPLEEAICHHLPHAPWYFPEEAVSQVSQKFMAAEITREKIFQNLHQEIPYKTYVQTDRWEDAEMRASMNALEAEGAGVKKMDDLQDIQDTEEVICVTDADADADVDASASSKAALGVQKNREGITLYQTIYVGKLGQKKLMIGEGGRRIRQIGIQARCEMEEWLGCRVHLFLHVKVQPEWDNNAGVCHFFET